jgi:hypothetical protein
MVSKHAEYINKKKEDLNTKIRDNERLLQLGCSTLVVYSVFSCFLLLFLILTIVGKKSFTETKEKASAFEELLS